MKILIACGGTGGHLFPALTLANSLEEKIEDTQILLTLTKQTFAKTILDKKYQIGYLSFVPLRFKNINSWLRFLKGFIESIWLLMKFDPDVVVGFGGYASSIIVLFASLVNKKTIIYEPNVVAGRANRVLGFFVNRVAINFVKTKYYFPNKNKIRVVHNYLRNDLIKIDKINARRYFDLDPDKFTILVIGGSQGAQKINFVFLETVKRLKDKFKFQIIHLAGFGDYQVLLKEYAKLNIKARVFDFLKEVSYAYNASDLVVSRAGAATINEIVFYNLASVLIPYPYAYGHQKENAGILTDLNLAELIDDKNLDVNILSDKIIYLLTNPVRLSEMQEGIRKIFNCFNKDDLATQVISLCEE